MIIIQSPVSSPIVHLKRPVRSLTLCTVCGRRHCDVGRGRLPVLPVSFQCPSSVLPVFFLCPAWFGCFSSQRETKSHARYTLGAIGFGLAPVDLEPQQIGRLESLTRNTPLPSPSLGPPANFLRRRTTPLLPAIAIAFPRHVRRYSTSALRQLHLVRHSSPASATIPLRILGAISWPLTQPRTGRYIFEPTHDRRPSFTLVAYTLNRDQSRTLQLHNHLVPPEALHIDPLCCTLAWRYAPPPHGALPSHWNHSRSWPDCNTKRALSARASPLLAHSPSFTRHVSTPPRPAPPSRQRWRHYLIRATAHGS